VVTGTASGTGWATALASPDCDRITHPVIMAEGGMALI
jgi:hypothetical protein